MHLEFEPSTCSLSSEFQGLRSCPACILRISTKRFTGNLQRRTASLVPLSSIQFSLGLGTYILLRADAKILRLAEVGFE